MAEPQPLAVFPEGTTSNGRALLPFRSTLLHAVAPPPPGASVRPVAIDYRDSLDAIAWHSGEPGLANALRVLGMKGTRRVTVRLLDPLPPSDDRKALARDGARGDRRRAPFRRAARRAKGARRMTDLPKTFRVKSFGCQMNVYDGERMGELLAATGMTAADGDDADLVVLNTCHIREKAADRAYSDVGRLVRDDGSRPMVALAGCVAQAEGGEAKRRSKNIDLVVGPQAYHRLPEMVAAVAAGQRPVDTDMPAIAKFGALPPRRRSGPSAFLTVQEGCDKFCTYCVVPYTRGAEISRPFADIVAEAQALVEGGAREITLLGQNVNAYDGGPRHS